MCVIVDMVNFDAFLQFSILCVQACLSSLTDLGKVFTVDGFCGVIVT